ncbi:methyl-accepting chemotaxis protein [Actinoplanes sp. NPDC051851]|uniref:methyl-accepting chemotaxis protein n=1 Tax=Actinoplanes sp. NPDC051851 TaxID=3154753 RepID=UPI00344431D5
MTAPEPEEALFEIAEVCRRAASGDLESRVPPLGESEAAGEARLAINELLDRTDAFVREAGAASAAGASGAFHRRFLVAGMGGAYRRAAVQISDSMDAMSGKAGEIAEAATARVRLADELETAVLALSTRIASAAGEMGRSANGLSDFARRAVGDAEQGLETVTELRRSSGQIRHAVDLINRVAMQTQLLSLNASIEAARAGTAGRGFSVVANEVKTLANETGESSGEIMDQVDAVQQASADAVRVLRSVTESIREMSGLIDGIATAVEGGENTEESGLTELAEVLRAEVTRFLVQARQP